MPRYFFHLKDGTTRMDEEGVELAGYDEAREAAVVNSGEILRVRPRSHTERAMRRMRIMTEEA